MRVRSRIAYIAESAGSSKFRPVLEHAEVRMNQADRTLKEYAVSCGGDDVASVHGTHKLSTQRADRTAEIRAEDVLEAIEIAPSVEATQEIRGADILEETPAPVEVAIELDSRFQPASIAPTAYDIISVPVERGWGPRDRAESTGHIAPVRSPRRLLSFVMVAMTASLVILGAAAVRAFLRASDAVEEAPPPVAAVAPSTMPIAPVVATPPAPPPAPLSEARTLPTTGTVLLAHGVKRVTIDGVHITSSAIVPCGVHTVGVGRRTRTADVPCGGMYFVTP